MDESPDTQEAEAQEPRRRRGIYLLPNLFTTAAFFFGFYAIVAATNDKFEHAAIAVLVAFVLDGLDGRVARMTNTQSAFGAEYDSLSDLVSFGLAPALVMYEWSLSSLRDINWQLGKIGWLAVFIFSVCAALRLARFNTRASSTDKRYFQGLPSPSAAAVVIGMVWVCFDAGISGPDAAPVALPLTVIVGILMVSKVSYYSFKDINLHNRVPFFVILIVVLAFVLASINPPVIIFGAFLLYTLSGPVIALVRRVRKRSNRTE
jgi:CDP-diacylglycerol--serine O-phosphatidyltransferase